MAPSHSILRAPLYRTKPCAISLVPAISIRTARCPVIGMAGTSPAMTRWGLPMFFRYHEMGRRLKAFRMGWGRSADEIAKKIGPGDDAEIFAPITGGAARPLVARLPRWAPVSGGCEWLNRPPMRQ